MLKPKEIRHCESGQSIIEFIIFLPLILFLFTMLFNVGDAIMASINQQKATRGYFYRLAKGNPYLPESSVLELLSGGGGISRIGVFSIGYREKGEGEDSRGESFAPCFKFDILFGERTGETCEEPIEQTQFIRVFTAYGVCGQSYTFDDTLGFFRRTFVEGSQLSTCQIQE